MTQLTATTPDANQTPRRSALIVWTARGAIAAAALSVLALVAVVVVLPRAVHGAALTVRTGSMTPALSVGELVVVRPVTPAALHVGDIATYRSASGGLVTHRIVAIDGTEVVFRGDANPVSDPQPVPASDVVGTMWFAVPYLGELRERLAAERGWIVAAGVLALSAYAIAQFTSYARDRRRS